MGSLATVVSMLPWDVNEKKPQVYPGDFFIPAAEKGKLSCLVITDSVIYIPLDEIRGKMSQTVPALDMAKSIVEDYRRSLVYLRANDAPGLFYIPGGFTAEQVDKEFKDEVLKYRKLQEGWFSHLITVGTDEWARSRQRMFIPEICRHAATYMGQNPEWALALTEVINVNCKFCTSLIPSEAVVCPNCHNVLDPVRFKSLRGASA